MTYDNRTEVRKVLIITLLLNVFVMGLKALVGYWTGSLSLMADALHSVTDSANNVLGLVAIKFSSPLPDREHPYGHNKFEAVGALGIAAFLGIACFEIVQGAVERIIKGGEPVRVSPPELWLLLIVLGVNIFVAFYERNVGRRVGSSILVADATHTMSDVWVTISVIGGLIGVWLGYQLLDVLLAFPVALLVFWSGWSVLTENLPWLVDQMAIAPETIHTITVSVPGVLNCHDIASRGVIGRQVFIEMHLIVDARDVETAHNITEEVERQLEQRFSPVRILIHVEPPAYQSERVTFESEQT
ncbi:cation diffusion facilitator family transporter [Aphanizomenon flos-aquae NRERC-008]|jgi:cation diffusion facilitator family transporter|uniref:Cation transporter n=2 Tax=Aphanizomenon flos-aquae TaxID=1176 RepID=A0A1B7WXX4_APHFL|nr:MULTISPECIES: cation diffusion facilitator family transporter [Aphanizomenon]MCE2905433.1 cation diffusion facilitator family transporter [Anabaena sp. CoA2_C59]MDJ0506004.1 cation diffusion facilitator family transporter [Nostocales cyanobacterium LE14-WE12]NTW19112.1 cation transporter [Nostocales cyanobacterium W4_Combined_metabat2_030]OBQ20770.1 MAG: cation transporter [Anabaena sp. WA113]OBQ41961.1 MAG: cation transporter [Aphanizomenon flos-aquae WA102]